MPQTLTDAWRSMLGENAERDHQQLLHTLGNLTLTGYNSELSNSPFSEKQKHYADSNVTLNSDLATAPVWDAAAIRTRGEQLAQSVLVRWPSFAPEGNSADGANMPRSANSRPVAVVLRGQRRAVNSWVDLVVTTARLAAEITGPVLWQQLQDKKPNFFAHEAEALRSPALLVNGCYYEGNSNSETHRRNCRFILEQSSIAENEWHFETVG